MARFVAWCAALVVAAAAAQAQTPGKAHRVGWLTQASIEAARGDSEELRRALLKRGYHDHQLVFDVRAAAGDLQRLSALARDLAAARPDVIVATTTPSTRAAKDATSSIPIVFVGVGDPVGSGFVQSLARPGTNMTGIASMTSEYMPKTLEVLRELLPRAKRIAVLATQNPAAMPVVRSIETAAKAQKLSTQVARVASLTEIKTAFEMFNKQRADGLIVLSDGLLLQHRAYLAEIATQTRMPAVYAYAANVEAGGLMSYGPDPKGAFDELADYVDRILKGARPGEVAIRGPARFELLVNLRAARAIGITVPDSLLGRANRVIE
jgi:putative ABC transport system substrate-binding protein